MAQAEAQAAKMFSDAIASSGNAMILLRKIEASREIANTLANSKNIVYLPSDKQSVLLGLGQL